MPTTTSFTSANETILNQLRPYKGYNAIGAIEPWFNSNYNSLQMTVQKRLSGNNSVNASYTWSHTLTTMRRLTARRPHRIFTTSTMANMAPALMTVSRFLI